MAKSRIATIVADVFSNTAVTENKVHLALIVLILQANMLSLVSKMTSEKLWFAYACIQNLGGGNFY